MAIPSRRVRFTVLDEMLLFQEIVAMNPFKDHNKWEEIQQKLVCQTGKKFSVRLIKDHTDHLVKMYLVNGRASLRKLETEEEHEKLLQEIVELRREYKSFKSDSGQKGVEVREESTSLEADALMLEPASLGVECIISEAEQSSPSTSPIYQTREGSIPDSNSPRIHNIEQVRRKRDHDGLQKDTLSYLQEKMKREQMLKEKELELEEKRLALDKEKFQVEKEERKIRLEMDMKEREARLKNEAAQLQSNLTMQKFMIEMMNYLKKNKD